MQKPTWASLLLLVATMLAPTITHADAKKFRARDDGGSRVTFVSDAPLETITGLTTKVVGTITMDPADISKAKGKFKVPVASLRTGDDLRDEHLRGKNWLDAKSNPHVHFEITEVVKGSKALKPNKDTKVKVKGKLTVNGITQKIVAEGKVRWIPLTDELKKTPGINGDVLRIKADFSTKLEDHHVSVPSIVRLKVSNDINVSVDIRAIAGK